jgi:hypothetical protein
MDFKPNRKKLLFIGAMLIAFIVVYVITNLIAKVH